MVTCTSKNFNEEAFPLAAPESELSRELSRRNIHAVKLKRVTLSAKP